MEAASQSGLVFLTGANLPPVGDSVDEQRFERGDAVPADIDSDHLAALKDLNAVGTLEDLNGAAQTEPVMAIEAEDEAPTAPIETEAVHVDTDEPTAPDDVDDIAIVDRDETHVEIEQPTQAAHLTEE